LKRFGYTFLFHLFLVLLSSTYLKAQPSLLNYTCYRNVSPITIDGNLSDPAWRDIPWSEPFSDIEGTIRPSPQLETRLKMAWDSSFLYIAARLKETHLFATLTERDTIIFHDPDFEVFVDPDGDSRNYYEFEINALGTEMDLFMPNTYKNGGIYNLTWNLDGIRSAVKLEGTLNVPSDLDTAWTVEIAIPWNAFKGGGHSDPAPDAGTIWRINFSRVQWNLEINDNTYQKITDPTTGKPVREENWVWSPTGVINMHIPEQWGYVEFSGEPPPPRWWVWMLQGNRAKEEWSMVLHDLDTLGIRGILLMADTATLAQVASLASTCGMEVHAWILTMNRGDADPAQLLPEIPVVCGIYLPALQEGDQFSQAVSAALAGGANGIALFSFNNITDTIRNQIKAMTHVEF